MMELAPMNHGLKTYIVFWLSQSLSQLGSAMTGFTLILWTYEQNGAAMTVSLLSFFNYVPYRPLCWLPPCTHSADCRRWLSLIWPALSLLLQCWHLKKDTRRKKGEKGKNSCAFRNQGGTCLFAEQSGDFNDYSYHGAFKLFFQADV